MQRSTWVSRRARGGSPAWLLALIVFWCGAVVVGWAAIADYQFKVDDALALAPVSSWPTDTEFELARDESTLLFFLHPKCPCSRASVAELERLLFSVEQRQQSAPRVIVVATTPAEPDDDWLTSSTVERCRRLPGASLYIDREGVEAARFGVGQSGTVMLFDADGRCRYAGGITMARGHEGDNLGRASLAALLQGSTESPPRVPAFGCRLCLPEAATASVGTPARYPTSLAPPN